MGGIFGSPFYRDFDSAGRISHQEESSISVDSSWLVGESKICESRPYPARPSVELDGGNHAPSVASGGGFSAGYAFAHLTCDRGPAHQMQITFWGRREQPEYESVSWKCTRGAGDFNCVEISGKLRPLQNTAPRGILLPPMTDSDKKAARGVFAQPDFFTATPDERRLRLRSVKAMSAMPDDDLDGIVALMRPSQDAVRKQWARENAPGELAIPPLSVADQKAARGVFAQPDFFAAPPDQQRSRLRSAVKGLANVADLDLDGSIEETRPLADAVRKQWARENAPGLIERFATAISPRLREGQNPAAFGGGSPAYVPLHERGIANAH